MIQEHFPISFDALAAGANLVGAAGAVWFAAAECIEQPVVVRARPRLLEAAKPSLHDAAATDVGAAAKVVAVGAGGDGFLVEEP